MIKVATASKVGGSGLHSKVLEGFTMQGGVARDGVYF